MKIYIQFKMNFKAEAKNKITPNLKKKFRGVT